jgi:hypothetical protein
MLTKTDLSKIRKVVREEVESESGNLRQDPQGEIKFFRIQIQNDIKSLSDQIKNSNIKLSKIEKVIKTIANFFDKESLKTQKRINIIEKQLRISPASF